MTIHTADDCKGLRRVTLDGVEVKNCTYADDETGEVRFFDDPPQLDVNANEIATHSAFGVVEVEFI